MTEMVQQARYDLILKLLEAKHGKILDIGCQSGEMSYKLYKLGFDVYGVDIDDKLVQIAKDNYPQIKFECADCNNEISFPTNFFDIVCAGDIIEHMVNTDIFVNEVNRILKTGGLFILTTPTHNRVKNMAIVLFTFEKHFDPEFPHYRFYSLKSLKNVLEKRGFTIMKVEYIGRFRPFSNNMIVLSKKIENKSVYSQYHF